jgi:hypothetical protein
MIQETCSVQTDGQRAGERDGLQSAVIDVHRLGPVQMMIVTVAQNCNSAATNYGRVHEGAVFSVSPQAD